MENFTCVYPNQKIVTLHKAPADKNHLYGIFNKETLFSACRDLTGNELKVFLYLCSNQPEYSMALSSSDISENTGVTVDGVRTAIRGLTKKNYLVRQSGLRYDLYEAGSPAATATENTTAAKPLVPSEKSQTQPPKNQVLTPEKPSDPHCKTTGEIIQEDYKKNTIDNNRAYLDSSSSGWEKIFKRIKVTYYPHSIKAIENAVGGAVNVHVVRRLVSENWPAFERGLEQQEGYRLNTLLNLAKAQYTKWESIIRSEDAQRVFDKEERRKQPKINYNALPEYKSKTDGLGDISAPLDEIFITDDIPSVSCDTEPTAIFSVLAEMRASRENDF